MQAYHKLDKDGSGVIDMDDLKDGYDFKNARARSVMTNEEAANRFLLMFDKNNDKKVRFSQQNKKLTTERMKTYDSVFDFFCSSSSPFV